VQTRGEFQTNASLRISKRHRRVLPVETPRWHLATVHPLLFQIVARDAGDRLRSIGGEAG